jgi:hypothetical protein
VGDGVRCQGMASCVRGRATVIEGVDLEQADPDRGSAGGSGTVDSGPAGLLRAM